MTIFPIERPIAIEDKAIQSETEFCKKGKKQPVRSSPTLAQITEIRYFVRFGS